MRLVFIGDIVGNPGRKLLNQVLPELRKEKGIDFCVANGENSSGGNGITYGSATEIFEAGIDVITTGNHVWGKKEALTFIDNERRILRPANYPPDLPGKGSGVYKTANTKGLYIGVLNVMGRVFMEPLDCPFRIAVKEVEYLKSFTNIIIVDMHAEATSEKCALGWYLDGRVSCVIGTHTHIQTSDEKILPEGTGYITDAGMTGPYSGILGIDRHVIIDKFLKHMPIRFEVAKGQVQLNGIIFDVDENTGKTTAIERLSIVSDI